MNTEVEESDNWFEKAVLISGQMKVGGTLFSNMLDGSPDFFVLPDLPEFRILFQKEFKNSRHMAADWLCGFNNIFQGVKSPIFNFDPDDESQTIPIEYCDLPLSSLNLRGSFRGLDSWEKYFSLDDYHTEIKNLLSKNANSKKDVIRSTVYATIKGCKDKPFGEKLKRWGYRGIQSAYTSIFMEVDLQDNEVEQFFKTFPQGQAIFQVRDPHAIVLSLGNHFKEARSSFGMIHRGISFLNDCKIAHESLKQTIDFQNKYSNENLMFVKFEKLIENPKEIMDEVCSFLGIPYSSVLTFPTLFGQRSRVITAFETDGSKVDKSKSDIWKKKLSSFRKLIIDSFIVENVYDYKKLWGYDTCFPRPLVWIFRVLILLPFLFVCEKVGGRILSSGREFKKITGLSYIARKNSSNVELKELSHQSYEELYGGTSFHYIQQELARVARKNNLGQFKRVLIVGDQRNLFALHFAKSADLVHIVHPDKEFLEWLSERASLYDLKNLTTFSLSSENFKSNEKYDLIFMQDEFDSEYIDHGTQIKNVLNLLEDNGKIYITGPGFGYILIKILINVKARRFKAALKALVNMFRAILCDQILQFKSIRSSFFSENTFMRMLQKNNLIVGRIGVIDTIMEGVYPAKVGLFVRKWEAICGKKNI
jgi:hypothetical protein